MPKNALGKVQGIDDDGLLRLILKPEDRSRLGLEGQIWQPRGALTGGRAAVVEEMSLRLNRRLNWLTRV